MIEASRIRAAALPAALLLGCGASAAPPAVADPPARSAVAPPIALPSTAAASADPSAAPVAPPPAAAAPPPTPEPPFPPPAFAPPFERTAKPGDGTWTPLVPAGGGEPALIYRTTVHPDRTKPQVYAAIVAVDLRRVGLRFVAGTKEPPAPSVPADHRPGLVPAADQANLVAVFNGGFMARHGQWGITVGADVLLPLRDDGCTIALLGDGGVMVRTQAALGPAPAKATAMRQTPPCLVEQGEIHPALLGPEKPRRWGMSETGGVDIRRSAIGVMPGGRTLMYGLGEWITPRQMAEAMRTAGAADAAELDVNWSYTRFLLYGPRPSPGAPPEVTATLVPKIKHGPRQYVVKPEERDFFYLVRLPSPATGP